MSLSFTGTAIERLQGSDGSASVRAAPGLGLGLLPVMDGVHHPEQGTGSRRQGAVWHVPAEDLLHAIDQVVLHPLGLFHTPADVTLAHAAFHWPGAGFCLSVPIGAPILPCGRSSSLITVRGMPR